MAMHKQPLRLANIFFMVGFTYDDLHTVAQQTGIPRDALVRNPIAEARGLRNG